MNVSGVSLKEAMEAIEERIPKGRLIVTVVLCLAILAVVVWLCEFLYHSLVSPLAAALLAWTASGKIKITHEAWATLISALVVGVVSGTIFSFLSRYFHGKLFSTTREIQIKANEAADLYDKLLSESGAFWRALDRLEGRVSGLERGKQDADISTDT